MRTRYVMISMSRYARQIKPWWSPVWIDREHFEYAPYGMGATSGFGAFVSTKTGRIMGSIQWKKEDQCQ